MSDIQDPFCPFIHTEDKTCLTCIALRKQRVTSKEDNTATYWKGRRDAMEAIRDLWHERDLPPAIVATFTAAEEAALGNGGSE